MKTSTIILTSIFILNLLFNPESLAQGTSATPLPTAVQRTPQSSVKDFQQYLKDENLSSFVDAYIQTSAAMELKTPLLEQCLEEMYLGAPFEDTCFESVKSLTSRPLNRTRREILVSYLEKLRRGSKSRKAFYQSFYEGLSLQNAKSTTDKQNEEIRPISQLEMNAWRKAIAKKIDLTDSALLINGVRVKKLESWSAPVGVFQWTFVSNTHAPIIRLSTFSQFASESVKSLEELNKNSCESIAHDEPAKYGIMKIEVFQSRKCIAKYDSPIKSRLGKEHLGQSAQVVNLEEKSHRSWLWTGLLIVGVGAALALKDKNVQVTAPSFR